DAGQVVLQQLVSVSGQGGIFQGQAAGFAGVRVIQPEIVLAVLVGGEQVARGTQQSQVAARGCLRRGQQGEGILASRQGAGGFARLKPARLKRVVVVQRQAHAGGIHHFAVRANVGGVEARAAPIERHV